MWCPSVVYNGTIAIIAVYLWPVVGIDVMFSILFADDTNMFIKGNHLPEICNRLNEGLSNIQDWLSCNNLSLNVLKTYYIIFTPQNKTVDGIDIKNNYTSIERGV